MTLSRRVRADWRLMRRDRAARNKQTSAISAATPAAAKSQRHRASPREMPTAAIDAAAADVDGDANTAIKCLFIAS